MFSFDVFVFSEDDVFSYNVVDRRGMRPTVLFMLDAPSNFPIVVRDLAGDVAAKKKINIVHIPLFLEYSLVSTLVLS